MDMYVPVLPLQTIEIEPADPHCVHYWIINNRCIGICKKCGAERDFEKLRLESKGAYRSHKKVNPVS